MISGDKLFGSSGRQVARIVGRKAFGPDGRYVGTVVGSRLICRSTDRASISSPFAASIRAPFARANLVRSALWGDELPIRD